MVQIYGPKQSITVSPETVEEPLPGSSGPEDITSNDHVLVTTETHITCHDAVKEPLPGNSGTEDITCNDDVLVTTETHITCHDAVKEPLQGNSGTEDITCNNHVLVTTETQTEMTGNDMRRLDLIANLDQQTMNQERIIGILEHNQKDGNSSSS